MNVIEVKLINGVEVLKFNATPAMKTFAAAAFCDPALSGKDAATICRSAGISDAMYKRFLSYEPHFSEWLESERMRLGGKNKRAMLEAVGMKLALDGDFQFWKPLAMREGVISPDRLDIGAALPANLNSFKDMNEQQLLALQDSLMATLRSDADAGEISLAEGPQGWERQGDSGGASEVPEGQVVLADELGVNGESAQHLGELDDF